MSLADVLHDAVVVQPQSLRQDTHDSEITVVLNKPHARLSSSTSGHHVHYSDDIEQHHTRENSDTELRLRPEYTSKSLSRISGYKSPPDTPSTRTGPPRSLSYAYAIPGSPSLGKHSLYHNTISESSSPAPFEAYEEFSMDDKDFRGALEMPAANDRKGKRKQHKEQSEDSWNINPMKWFQESPKEEKPAMDFPLPETSVSAPVVQQSNTHHEDEEHKRSSSDSEKHSPTLTIKRHPKRGASDNEPNTPSSPLFAKKEGLRRAFSVPHTRPNSEPKDKAQDNAKAQNPGSARWAKLRSLLPQIVHPNEPVLPGPSMVTSQAVNITDELITGGLSTLMLRLWFERDEKGHRRIPALFHRLRIRVSDSLHPMHRHGSVFRIECEYANGAARWVVYRELRDFLSLHAHYTVSNVYNRNVDDMPEFPTTSLPYFKFLKKEGREKGSKIDKADFARLQREALENYLISLIRAVVSVHPSSRYNTL